MSEKLDEVKVSDPFGAAADRELPTVASALDPASVNEEFHHGLPRLATDGRVTVRSITVIRHKPGRRCVIEYDVRVRGDDRPRIKVRLLGKIRARRFGNEAYRLLDAIWSAGFQSDSADGVSVPEPIGVIPKFQMWLQRKVPGKLASLRLSDHSGIVLARKVADAIHKLHRAGIATERTHTIADELAILHECMDVVAKQRPALASRTARILKACDELGAILPVPARCGIHRDFYPAQVIVDDPRLYLIDFDLYCMGDPALDVGNFIGHITEESLRTLGDATALKDREQALEDRFVELSGEAVRVAVRAYTTLTLVRHIYLSTQFPERAPFTERLVELCETRLRLR
jgi:hypothetical protein